MALHRSTPGRESRTRRIATAIALGLLLSSAPARSDGIHVALTTPSATVLPGSEFDVAIEVTDSGSVFNSYDAVVVYDPGALTFEEASPVTLQEASYMVNACGFTFQRFTSSGDSLVVSHSILCNEVALPGPGQLYRLRFKAGQTSQPTQVTFRHVQFYNDGLYVNPIVSSDLPLTISSVGGVDSRDPGGAGARLDLPWPNPTEREANIDFELSRPAAIQLGVWDLRGSIVATLAAGTYDAGVHHLSWNGRIRGERAVPGIYFVRLRTAEGARVRRLIIGR